MVNTKKVLIPNILLAFASAVLHFFITLGIFVAVARKDTYIATIMFFVYTIVIIVMDMIEKKIIYPKILIKKREKKLTFAETMLIGFIDGASNKTSVYFLYIAIMVWSAIFPSASKEGVEVNGYVSLINDYLYSMRYSILFLMAGDKFVYQLFKDIKTVEEVEAECGCSP